MPVFGENEDVDLTPPGSFENSKALSDYLGKAAAEIKSLRADKAAAARAAADFSAQLQQLQEQAVAPRTRAVSEGASHKDMSSRYTDDSGRLFIKSTERRLKFGGREVIVEQKGLLDDPDLCCEWQQDLQRLVTRRSLVRLVAKNRATPSIDAEILHMMSRAPQSIRGALEKAISDSAGAGAEWIPDGTFTDMYEEFKTPNQIAALFPTINMPASTMKQPRLGAGARPYIRSAISSDDPSSYAASTPVSSDSTITVTDWSVRVVYDEMDGEDAVVMMEPFLRRIVADALNDGYGDAVVNGDTTASHQDDIANWNLRSRWGDSGLGGAADHRRIFMGLRALAVDNSQNVDMGSLQTVAALMTTLVGGLGERAASQLAIIVSPEVFYQKLLGDTNVLTLDKLGAGATLLSGQLGSVFGIPIVTSRWVGADLNGTAGLYTGSGATSSALAVDLSAFAHFQRRGVQVDMERQIINGANHVVATMRRLFKSPSADTNIARCGFNWLS
jgi:hypothetical protein